MKKALFILFFLLAGTVSAYTSQTFTTNGNFTVPANITSIFVEVWGAGGNSSSVPGGGYGAGGGGGGAYSASVLTVTPGAVFPISVGQEATSSPSYFNATTTVFAAGGGNASLEVAGAGGQASTGVGTIKHSGGSGGTGTAGGANTPGSGGGAGGSQTDGTAGTTGSAAPGGAGGISGGGNGGNAATVIASSGLGAFGDAPGGGGGGSYGTLTNNVVPRRGGGGQVVVYYGNSSFSYINFSIRDILTTSVVSVPTNITLQSPTNLITYRFNSTTGSYSTFLIESGLYTVQISATGYPITYALLNVAGTNQNVTYYVDSAAEARVFTVQDTLGNLVVNASVSFARNVGGSIVVVVQAVTDFTGFFTVNLDPNTIYSVTATEPSGVYSNFSGAILAADATTTYLIRMLFSTAGSSYPAAYNNTFASPAATYNNTTQTINVTWEVIAGNADLVYWSINTTYNSTPYLTNRTSPAAGGIASFNITGVDLSVQDTIYVRFQFLRSGFDPVSFTLPFQFSDITPGNFTVSGSNGLWSLLPVSALGRALIGMIILLFAIAGTYSLTSMPTPSAAVGIVLTGLFSLPAVNMFPLVYGLITIAVLVVVIISDEVSNR